MVNTEIRLVIFFAAKYGEALYSQKKQVLELAVAAKFRLKLKQVETTRKPLERKKTTRSFRYDLNQIPDDYTVEVTNRFKGLDLIDRVPKELRTEVHDIV